jgi:putative addiction module component (TIGR02574 family)
MTKAVEEVVAKALEFEVSERAGVAAELLVSLDGEPDQDVEAAWAAEIEQRMARIKADTAKLVAWEDVKSRIEKEILKR